MMKINCLPFIFLLLSNLGMAQAFQGTWVGEVQQDGKPDQFIYTMELEQDGEKVFGTARSKSAEGGNDAKFEIGGIWGGRTLTLQEVKQLEPPNARWCLKHIRLTLYQDDQLSGRWEAEGCTPGDIVLRKQVVNVDSDSTDDTRLSGDAVGLESEITGKFTGTLSQSDREHGFYFEIKLDQDGTGTSRIISDGAGGNASHFFRWRFDKSTSTLYFTESRIVNKSVEEWPWCIKKAKLALTKETNRVALKGGWEGFIEGYDQSTGPCAPGFIYLEKPIFKKEEIVEAGVDDQPTTPLGVQQYQQHKNREVEVNRVLEVKSNTVRVRVWDNGTIDGDALSLFVNGELILENYRVTRRKHETIIQLDKPTNYLILHALNLGSISPNTVAVSVDDGLEEQVVIMSSNLAKSGAIMIRQFTVNTD